VQTSQPSTVGTSSHSRYGGGGAELAE
jgi:hypothetical protein